jgi:ATP-dependent Lon protease
MIPIQNAGDLMLREDVIDAVKKRKFQIYAVETIDEGIEILTGKKSGTQRPDGTFEAGTVNSLVDKKLEEYSKRWQAFEWKKS